MYRERGINVVLQPPAPLSLLPHFSICIKNRQQKTRFSVNPRLTEVKFCVRLWFTNPVISSMTWLPLLSRDWRDKERKETADSTKRKHKVWRKNRKKEKKERS